MEMFDEDLTLSALLHLVIGILIHVWVLLLLLLLLVGDHCNLADFPGL